MYWGYLTLFLLAVFTPTIIRDGILFVPEETVEGVLIFLFGVIGFSLSVAKEKAIFKHIKARLYLEREKHDITKDLSDSYSYIGEANRKIDVLQTLVDKFPEMVYGFQTGGRKHSYQALKREFRTYLKSDVFSVRIVDLETKCLKNSFGEGVVEDAKGISAEALVGMDRGIGESDGFAIIRASEEVGGVTAFLLFPKNKHQIENIEILKALVAQALAFFVLETACEQCLLKEKSHKHYGKADRY